MRRTMAKSKIHRAVITGADVDYEGSLTVDRDLMDAADLLPFEKVQVVNVNNGARLETYVIEAEAGSGTIQLNGAAARLGVPGDMVIIISYAEYESSELEGFQPRIVFVDGENRIAKARIRREK
ncbi:MAG TPA: aspartate 1-decarboxylase [Gemmatimonadaceae bacterium]|jgi:aspartate 1-decarboxylase|nr:aspartate 1-decarboxylase [Gemmatimonadaceae bacterium]